jgi:hypothetical protein
MQKRGFQPRKDLWQKNMDKWMNLDFSRRFSPDDQRIPEPPKRLSMR